MPILNVTKERNNYMTENIPKKLSDLFVQRNKIYIYIEYIYLPSKKKNLIPRYEVKLNRVGPQARRLMRAYWGKSTMVARAGGYYGTGFKGARGVTQGNPLSPTIFNVVVDAVVRHWVTLSV